jgi:hypothetical protein
MRESIELCAGRVRESLARFPAINIMRLSELLGERSVIVYQALGWLAREGKIRYEQRGNQVYVSLSQQGEASGAAAPGLMS